MSTTTEENVDKTERDHPKYLSLIDDSEEGNDSNGNDGYLKPNNDHSRISKEGAVSLEMTHIESNSEHDVDGMVDPERPVASDEDTEAYTDEYLHPTTNVPRYEEKIKYLIMKAIGNTADENGYLMPFSKSENNYEAATTSVKSFRKKHVNLNEGMKHSIHLNSLKNF